jgi:multidrug efflux system membrane fusion protein
MTSSAPTAKIRRVFLATCCLALVAGCHKKDAAQTGKPSRPPVYVQTAMSERKDMPLDLRMIGSVEAIANIAIQAQVGGELIGIHFEEGQEVKAQQLLYTIQPRLYATRLAEAQANLARDRASATNARLALNRQEELDRKSAGVKEELDKARANAEAADAAVKADEALVLIAETQVAYTTVESPIDGRTGATRVRPGALIKVGDDLPLTTVVQMAPIYVTFSIPEQFLAAVRAGMADRKITVSAFEPRIGTKLGEGDLTFIANTVDMTTGNVVLKATFKNTDRALWPGAFVDVTLHLDQERAVVVVPSPAVTIGQVGMQVWVVKEDQTVELRPINPGRTVGQESIILEGLKEGERIVVNGQSKILPGAKVIEKAASPTGGKPGGATAPVAVEKEKGTKG